MTSVVTFLLGCVLYIVIAGIFIQIFAILSNESNESLLDDPGPIMGGILWPITIPVLLGILLARLGAIVISVIAGTQKWRRKKKIKEPIVTCDICQKKLKKGEYR